MPATHALLARLVANRSEFFSLIEEVERAAHCTINPMHAAGVIDSEFAEREGLTREEAQSLLFQLAEPANAPFAADGRGKEKAR